LRDFGELAVVRRIPHHGIIRLVAISAERRCRRIETLATYGPELLSDAFVTGGIG